AEEFVDNFRSHLQLVGFTFRETASLLPANRADVALQVSNASFPRVVANDGLDRLFRELDLLRRNAVLLDLPGNQVLKGYMHLLFLGVPLEFDDLHAITQRFGNWIEHISCRDEQYLRKIERHVQIIITEGGVLLRIEGFQ